MLHFIDPFSSFDGSSSCGIAEHLSGGICTLTGSADLKSKNTRLIFFEIFSDITWYHKQLPEFFFRCHPFQKIGNTILYWHFWIFIGLRLGR